MERHLVDPSLAAALLGAGSERLLAEPKTLGFLFEAQVIHDLRVYAQAADARGVFHAAVDSAADNLHRVTAKMARPPLAKIVIVPSGIAHRRSDGVHVIPLTVLGA